MPTILILILPSKECYHKVPSYIYTLHDVLYVMLLPFGVQQINETKNKKIIHHSFIISQTSNCNCFCVHLFKTADFTTLCVVRLQK